VFVVFVEVIDFQIAMAMEEAIERGQDEQRKDGAAEDAANDYGGERLLHFGATPVG